MASPIDIKTKTSNLKPVKNEFNKTLVLESLEKNIITHWDNWGRFQQIWNNQAYASFKDFDKYLVLIYLIRDNFQQYADKFNYYSYDEFYALEHVIINKLNLIKIATELNIPKETIRRKVNELQRDEILSREGKKIILTRKAVNYQKPQASLEALSSFLEKKSNILQGEEWFGDSIKKNEIISYIEKYFTIIWLRFLKLQIPFLLRHRANFGDLETWMIWGNIALHHQKILNNHMNNSVESEIIDHHNYYKKISTLKIERGVNTSSIADITSIPRATVIRKLKWLVQKGTIKKNENLEYFLTNKGNLNKRIEENFRINQIYVAEFLSDFFDYYKDSKFSP